MKTLSGDCKFDILASIAFRFFFFDGSAIFLTEFDDPSDKNNATTKLSKEQVHSVHLSVTLPTTELSCVGTFNTMTYRQRSYSTGSLTQMVDDQVPRVLTLHFTLFEVLLRLTFISCFETTGGRPRW